MSKSTPTKRFRCDQCEALMINGVFCHETGCPNARKRWTPEREQWVRFLECFECGFEVEEGETCDCQDVEPLEPEDDEEDEDDEDVNRYDIGSAVIFPWAADPKSGQLTRKEAERGYRVLDGDKGDLHFTGYDVIGGETELSGVTLVTALDLTPEEVYEITTEIVAEAYASVGTECVEHS